MPHRIHCAVVLIILLGVTVPCGAQNAPNAPVRDPKACSDEQRGRSDPNAPQAADRGNQNLSEKLAQTDGVICPPNIDPDIKAPTPGGGRMLVVPPPGSPGGDPTVRPK